MKKYPGSTAALAALLAVLLALGCAGCSRGSASAAPQEPGSQPFDEPGGVIVSWEPPAMDLWQTLEFSLNGTPLQLPLTLEQLQNLGFELTPYEGETFWEIIPGWQTMFFMTHPDCGPYHVLEGVLINPDGGDMPVEQWSVQSITITAMPQRENGQEPVMPQVELVYGLSFDSCLQDVFDTYGVYSELIGPEGDDIRWTVRYNQDDRQRMNFLYLDDGAHMGSVQLTLTPDGWLDGTPGENAPTLEQLEALGSGEEYTDIENIDDPGVRAALQAALE